MKIKSSLKSIKKRDLNSKLVRRRGRVISSIKLIQNLKQDRSSFMDNENHKNTWNNFTKFVLVGNNCSNIGFGFNGNIFIIIYSDFNEFSFHFRE
jgi:ribosomal protein L36